MPKGQLYIKTSVTSSPTSTDTNVGNGWVDAFDTWGVSLTAGSRSRLMTPAPHKNAVTNKNVISHGASIVQSSFYKDVRQLSLEMHITAPSESAFLQRYAAFCTQVLDQGLIHMKLSSQPSVVYHLVYVDCQQFAEYNLSLAKFTLSLEEPHPEIRS